jgi:hypothetical protein
MRIPLQADNYKSNGLAGEWVERVWIRQEGVPLTTSKMPKDNPHVFLME